MTMTVHPARAVVLVGGSGLAGVWLAQQGVLAVGSGPTLETVLVAAIALGGAAAALGVAVTTVIALGESAFGRRAPRAVQSLPAPLRHFLMGSVATAVAAGIVAPAYADEPYPGWVAPQASATPSASRTSSPASSPTEVATPSSSPSPAVELPVTAAPPAAVVELHAESAAGPVGGESPPTSAGGADGGSAPTGDGNLYVVVRGDSLWRITAELLGPDASDAQVASRWPTIYEANRDLIGADPGLILPGQQLLIPREVAA